MPGEKNLTMKNNYLTSRRTTGTLDKQNSPLRDWALKCSLTCQYMVSGARIQCDLWYNILLYIYLVAIYDVPLTAFIIKHIDPGRKITDLWQDKSILWIFLDMFKSLMNTHKVVYNDNNFPMFTVLLSPLWEVMAP